MTFEEAREELEYCIEKNQGFMECRHLSQEAYHLVIEALEKQIPKKPTAYSTTWNGSIVYKCPVCGGPLGTKSFNVEQENIGCARCLSAIDWSEVK